MITSGLDCVRTGLIGNDSIELAPLMSLINFFLDISFRGFYKQNSAIGKHNYPFFNLIRNLSSRFCFQKLNFGIRFCKPSQKIKKAIDSGIFGKMTRRDGYDR